MNNNMEYKLDNLADCKYVETYYEDSMYDDKVSYIFPKPLSVKIIFSDTTLHLYDKVTKISVYTDHSYEINIDSVNEKYEDMCITTGSLEDTSVVVFLPEEPLSQKEKEYKTLLKLKSALSGSDDYEMMKGFVMDAVKIMNEKEEK